MKISVSHVVLEQDIAVGVFRNDFCTHRDVEIVETYNVRFIDGKPVETAENAPVCKYCGDVVAYDEEPESWEDES